MDGEVSQVWMHRAMDALASLLPSAQRHTFPGADHGVASDVIAPVFRAFCAS